MRPHVTSDMGIAAINIEATARVRDTPVPFNNYLNTRADIGVGGSIFEHLLLPHPPLNLHCKTCFC